MSNQEEEYNYNNVKGMNENTLGTSSNFADAFANINDEQIIMFNQCNPTL